MTRSAKSQLLLPRDLTVESFAPYGQVIDMPAGDPTFKGSGHSVAWRLRFEIAGTTRLSVSEVKYSGLHVNLLEQHLFVTQGFVQLSGPPCAIVVCTSDPADISTSGPHFASLASFRVQPGQGYIINRLVWHSVDRFPLSPGSALFLVIGENETAEELSIVGPRDLRRTKMVSCEAIGAHIKIMGDT